MATTPTRTPNEVPSGGRRTLEPSATVLPGTGPLETGRRRTEAAATEPLGSVPAAHLRQSWVTGGATLEAEYAGGDATLRLTAGPDDTDAAGQLLRAAVQHLRRHGTRRVHSVLDLTGPTGWTLLAALRSRVGTDVGAIAMRRAGSSVLVTVDLMPAAVAPGYTPARGLPARRPLDGTALPSQTRTRSVGTRP